MKLAIARLATICFVILFVLSSCTRINISSRLCPGVGVNVCGEQPEEPESDVILRVEDPTGVVFI